jgi:hypothetical protein
LSLLSLRSTLSTLWRCWQWMMSPLCVEHDEDAE